VEAFNHIEGWNSDLVERHVVGAADALDHISAPVNFTPTYWPSNEC